MTSYPDEAEDPVLDERIEHAIAPYRGRLTPEALDEARRLLAVMLTTHPVLAPLLDQVREQAATKATGVVPRRGSAQDALAPARKSGKRGG